MGELVLEPGDLPGEALVLQSDFVPALRRLTTALLRREPREAPGPFLLPPGVHVRRVQALAPQKRPSLALRARLVFPQEATLVLRGELPSPCDRQDLRIWLRCPWFCRQHSSDTFSPSSVFGKDPGVSRTLAERVTPR